LQLNVLSLFDGLSCGQIALGKAGKKVDQYYASEIDKYAIQVTQKNYPGTIQLGDVTAVKADDLPVIDLLIGGSPCQGFSNAGDLLNFNDPRSKLFFEYVRLLKEIRVKNPDVKFLLENVKMKQEWQNIITRYLGVEPIEINSSLLSAQHRKRMYWTNIEGVTQPADKGITLESILIDNPSEKLWLSTKEKNYMDRETHDGRTHWDFDHHSDTDKGKSQCIVANFFKGVPYNVLIDRRGNKCHAYECDFQGSDMCIGCVELDNFQGENYPTSTVRKFDPVECERLQTIPDNYTAGVSNTQRYKMIGNGWTVDVIAHIFSHLKD
jgi:DNA-cytosine methyltransferase